MRSHRPFHPAGARRGVALLAVLAVLALLTVLVVAFLLRAQMARNSAANYRATTSTRLLSDTVVNLVEAEINDATTYGTSLGAGGTGPYTWASQPGAIRVYDSSGTAAGGGGTGFQKLYRLYSAPSLTTSNITDILNVDSSPTSSASDTGGTVKTSGSTPEINANWATMPAQWVDLNAPVSVNDPATSTTGTIYPILDNRNPSNLAQCVPLPGFYVNTLTATTTPYPQASTAIPTTLNPPVMPVQWLYVLQSGQIVAATGGNGTQVTFTAPNAPSASNPIVGRIAYWTDDDTCKININTAGGSVSYRTDFNGSPLLVSDGTTTSTKVFFQTTGSAGTGNAWAPASWDTPRYAGSWDDIRLFAADQPIQGEYQRYPGHPATTILYYVLRALGVSMPEIVSAPNNGYNAYVNSVTSSISANTQAGGSAIWPFTSTLYGFLPRYNDNAGSQGGLAATVYQTGGAYVPPTPISVNRSRLYTSLGELLYSPYATTATPPLRTQNGVLNGNTTPGTPYFTRQQIETGKFFLTAHSHAPETTLFGTPRISMWPIPDTALTPTQGNKMAETALDKLIAFCTTTNTGIGGTPNPYYFQRYDAMSPVNDWTNESRNQSLYGYLQDLTSGGGNNSSIPGYANGSFVTKYGSSLFTTGAKTIANERDQILTEMVDYIRCTNLNDHSWNSTTNPIPTGQAVFAPKGEVIPLQISSTAGSSRTASTTQGLGRLLTLSEVALQVICTADGNNNLAPLNASNTNFGYKTTYTYGGQPYPNTATTVVYSPPQYITTTPASTSTPTVPASAITISNTIPVSPVIGSANDPGYVSNLGQAQYLRDTGGNIVDMYDNPLTGPATAANTPFPPNPTLANDSNYHAPSGTSADATVYSPVPPGNRMLQAALLFEPSSPMCGFDAVSANGGLGPDVNIYVSGANNIPLAGTNPFPSRARATSGAGSNGDGFLNGNPTTGLGGHLTNGWINNGDADQGGNYGFRFPMEAFEPPMSNINSSGRYNGWSGQGALNPQASPNNSPDTLGIVTGTYPKGSATTRWQVQNVGDSPYPFISNPFINNGPTLSLGGVGSGTFTVALAVPVTSSGVTTEHFYQASSVGFPQIAVNSPTLCAYGSTVRISGSNNNTYTTHAPDWWSFDNRIAWANNGGEWVANTSGNGQYPVEGFGAEIRGDPIPPNWISVGGWAWWDASGTNATLTAAATNGGTLASITTQYVTAGDVVRSVIPRDGDYRVTMARYSTPFAGSNPVFTTQVNAAPGTGNSDFSTPPQYNTVTDLATDMLMEPSGSHLTHGVDLGGALVNLAPLGATLQTWALAAKIPSALSPTGATNTNGTAATPDPKTSWDWDTGTISKQNGAYSGKPDEGSNYVGAGVLPYINIGNQATGYFSSYFTANRIVNSPVMFGSLPTGVAEQISWRNLLFRPQMTVSQGGKRTNGAPGTGVSSPAGPEDELLLDNFWMPVVQPYAISEPFSTAGKINMNYQILPFTYITRSTGIQAVLASELIARVPTTALAASSSSAAAYAGGTANFPGYSEALSGSGGCYNSVIAALAPGANPAMVPARLPLNLNDTVGSLRQFRGKFMTGDLFRSSAEICDIYLVPRDSMNSTRYLDWDVTTNLLDNSNADFNKVDSSYGSNGDFGLVSNNVRDKPYSDIYPRLTTKSNSYTVYYRVQALQNPPNADQTQWTEGQGVVAGEYRGSTSLERYLDPNNNTIPDYTQSSNNPAVSSSAKSLDSYYQWRTTANTAFAP